jgi:hypothetical protein
MFAKAPRESIGYVLVDEGGQAQAAHVACAVWRARRTVIVGDPLQLEPVVTVPEGIESELARHYGVDTPWMPSWNSAQGLICPHGSAPTLAQCLETGCGSVAHCVSIGDALPKCSVSAMRWPTMG